MYIFLLESYFNKLLSCLITSLQFLVCVISKHFCFSFPYFSDKPKMLYFKSPTEKKRIVHGDTHIVRHNSSQSQLSINTDLCGFQIRRLFEYIRDDDF